MVSRCVYIIYAPKKGALTYLKKLIVEKENDFVKNILDVLYKRKNLSSNSQHQV